MREAFSMHFDFEWVNANIMYGAYQRTQSVFENSDMMAIGNRDPPKSPCWSHFAAKSLTRYLARLRAAGVRWIRPGPRLLRKASALLQEAGYIIKDGSA